jgi:hypothetical protein
VCGTRECVIAENYVVVYRLQGDEVEILRVLRAPALAVTVRAPLNAALGWQLKQHARMAAIVFIPLRQRAPARTELNVSVCHVLMIVVRETDGHYINLESA